MTTSEIKSLLTGPNWRPFHIWHTKVSNRAILDSYAPVVIPFIYGMLFMGWVFLMAVVVEWLIK